MTGTGTTASRGSGQVVPSVIRATCILEALAAGPPTASLASLSKRLGYPRSSTLALCNSLVEAGLLRREPDGAYGLGPGVLELSRAFIAQTDLLSEFRRVAAESDFMPEQTLVCSVLRGRDVIYVGSRPGNSPLGVAYDIGLRLPAHCTASGLAMLSTLDEEELDRLYEGAEELERLTPRSVATVAELRQRLASTRRRGYAVDDEETAAGMLCIGAAVHDGGGEPVGAIAVSMAKGARSGSQLETDAGGVQLLAARISRALGAPGSG